MMATPLQSFPHWFAEKHSDKQKPWLILGKGPSFAKRTEFNLNDYVTVGLNHVVREQRVDLLHVIDLEVIETCADILEQNAGFIVLPWRPHLRRRPFVFSKKIRFYPSDATLEDYCRRIPVLKRLAEQGRVLWYNLWTAHRPHPQGSPVIRATAFSATAVLNLLSYCGAGKVFTLGIDGGSAYNPTFVDLEKTTKLQTGQASYDLQFSGFAETIFRTGIYFAPLDWAHPLKVYIEKKSTADSLAAAVLRFNIMRTTSMSVQFVADRQPENVRCIEITASQFIERDLRSYWSAGVKQLTSVGDFLEFKSAAAKPWINAYADHGLMWSKALLAAIAAGKINRLDVEAEVQAGHLRPSLLLQIDHKIADPLSLPISTVRIDKVFLATHGIALPPFTLPYSLLALLRRPCQNARLIDLTQKLIGRNLLDPVEYADIILRMLRKLFPAYIRLE